MSIDPAMRPRRRPLLFLGGLLCALLVTTGLVLLPAVQTWFARRLLAAHPEWGTSVERVSAGPFALRAEGVRRVEGAWELRAPEVVAEIDFADFVLNRRLGLRRLWAHGLELRMNGERAAPPAPSGGATSGVGPVAELLGGVLGRARLPADATADGIDLAGCVHLPGRGRPATFSLRGGGFAAGREGRLEIGAEWDGGDARAGAFATKGELRGRMADPRTFSEVNLRLDSTARGESFPGGAAISSEARLVRSPQGEAFRLALATPRHAVMEITGELKPGADRLRGAWKLDLNSADLAPLALGLPLPVFRARGEGGLEVDPAATAPRVEGWIALEVSGLEVLRPELKALGALAIRSEFDAGWRAGVVRVGRLSAHVVGPHPIADLEVGQPFTVDLARQEWAPADPGSDFARLRLEGVPTGWIAPWLGDLTVEGADWTGAIIASVSGGGLAVRTAGEVRAGGLALSHGAERILQGMEVSLAGSASTVSGGWQARVDRLGLRASGQELATLEARLGRLAGADQPVKAEGALRLNLAEAVRQPAAAGRLAIAGGEANLKFGATLGTSRLVQAEVRLDRLRGGRPAADLPSVKADVRLEIDPSGRIRFAAPIRLAAADRASDVSLAGEFTPRPGAAGGRLDARLAGGVLHAADGEALAGVLAAPVPAEARAPAAVDAAVPPWAGWEGRIEVDLAEVIHDAAVRMRDIKGRVELEAGKVRLEGLRGSLGDSGRATLSGALAFEAGRPEPFAAEVQVEVREFDPGPWFRVASGGAPATLEGAFTVSSRLRGRAASVGGLAEAVSGEVLLSSRGGIFRGLPVKVASAAAGGGRVAGLIAAAGNALGSLTGRRDPPAIAGRAQAVTEFAAGISTIPFDQLSLVLTRDAARNVAVREFTLIAPELRLTGAGTVLHRGGERLLGDSLALEFSLRARGRQGDLLRHLGLLEYSVDDLGYAACRIPLRVAGTPARPECGELAARLTALAAEKSGVADKAGELLNRIIGAPK